MRTTLRTLLASVFFCAATMSAMAADNSKNLAPGFVALPSAAKLVVMPVDVELYSLSAGGVAEPKADWTASAQSHMKAELVRRTQSIGLSTQLMDDKDADEFAEPMALHAAVARSIALHHATGGAWSLPTKAGKLDWSFDDAMRDLKAKSGADYGLFIWVRDSYASAERKLAMVGLALLGVGIGGGVQVGYASLVDLNSGQVLWFNQLARGTGDLREAKEAAESIDVLLTGFPKPR
ncbi:hypothetical protein [Pelomonas cellulosilytica]|uniref:Uncharacterized protein n=1 Tax=Pelomonas cellulosilytica TaxID=2906762 RepID=A0ABS8XSS7_9BURK|nr:hypothetical protein [Pelomonas sp. P8]MCE4554767.1 hypothetical protein [Pelomonas sp. P8]